MLEEMKLAERNGSGAETYGDHTSLATVGSQGRSSGGLGVTIVVSWVIFDMRSKA